MTRPARPALLLFATLIGAALLPVTAHAQATTPPPVQSQVVQVDDGHFAVSARAGTMLRRTARFRGTAPPGAAGPRARRPALRRHDADLGRRGDEHRRGRRQLPRPLAHEPHRRVPHARRPAGGRRGARRRRLPRADRHRLQVRDGHLVRARAPRAQDRVRAAPDPQLLGVAHRRLPCGTPVALYYQGRTIVVPVVDRGPFRHGVTWDLTEATAQALGFTTTDRIGAVRLRQPAAPAA